MATRPPESPIPASLPEVRARLEKRLFRIRSVWLPTPKELRDWDDTPAPLYLRWLGPDGFEVGPRLASMWAACFSPVVRGTLRAEDGGTRIAWEPAWPRFTNALLGLWAVALAVWLPFLAAAIRDGQRDPGVLGFWVVLAGSAVLSRWIGGTLGGAALEASLPLLDQAAREPSTEEDW